MSKNNQTLKRSWFFILLLTISSLALAGTAAYFSVFGLAKLFYGAGIGIIILASVLEFSKLVAVSYVYRYWEIISKWLRLYYIFGIIFIMILTSMGIYGFLTSAYQKSANKVEIRDSQIKIAENKKNLFISQLDRVNKAIESGNNRINNLTGVRNLQEKRLTDLYDVNKVSSAKRTETQISGADEQIKFLNQDITDKMKQSSTINDSISFYDQKIIEYKASDVSSEVGPLKYLSDLTGIPMNKVVNILVLLIIFVFDPMAIALLIGVNQLTMMDKGKDKSPLNDEKVKLPFIKHFKRKKNEEKEENDNISDENKQKMIYNKKLDFEEIKENSDEILEKIEDAEEKEEIIDQEINNEIGGCPEGHDEEKMTLYKDNIKLGLLVHHEIFGKGKIIGFDANKDRLKIIFEKSGIKELNSNFANLKEIICVEKASPYLVFSSGKIEEKPEEKIEEKPEEKIEENKENLYNEKIDELQVVNDSNGETLNVIEDEKKNKIQKFLQQKKKVMNFMRKK